MSSVDHLHAEANVLKVREHSEILSIQYLARCLEPDNVNNSITIRDTPKRYMVGVEPKMVGLGVRDGWRNEWRERVHNKRCVAWEVVVDGMGLSGNESGRFGSIIGTRYGWG